MQYQILEQYEPGEKWAFIAHGARYRDKAEALAACAWIEARGGRWRLIPCGKPRKRTGKATLVANTSRRVYWRTPGGFYVTSGPEGTADAIGRLQGGYPRLDSLMTLKGERPDVIAALCDANGQAKESRS